MSTHSAPALPRFRLSVGQLALSVILALLLIALVTSHSMASAAQRKHTEMYARTETATTNMLYTTRETLAYVDAAERYVLGVSPRRNAQLARALLGQRLSVVSDKGVTAGDSLTPEYRNALATLDGAIAQMPPGLLSKDQPTTRPASYCPTPRRCPMPVAALSTALRRNCMTPRAPSDAALLRGRLWQLVLLIAALAVAAVLLLWVGAEGRTPVSAGSRGPGRGRPRPA